MKIQRIIKTLPLIALPLLAANTSKTFAQTSQKVTADSFVRSITPQGINDSTAL